MTNHGQGSAQDLDCEQVLASAQLGKKVGCYESLAPVEQEGGDTQGFAHGAHGVGGADVSAAHGAQVDALKHLGHDQAKRDRPHQVGSQEGTGQTGPHNQCQGKRHGSAPMMALLGVSPKGKSGSSSPPEKQRCPDGAPQIVWQGARFPA